MTQNMDVDESDNANSTFTITGGNANFVNKHQTLFQQLEAAEKSIGRNNNDKIQIGGLSRSSRNARADTKQFRGQESIFKRPEAPISRCLKARGLPDFRKNPHKWVKYSLSDVSAVDNTDRGNTAAALSFLQEIESRKQLESQTNDSEMPDFHEKVLFKSRKADQHLKFNKSATLRNITAESTEEEKPIFRNNKLMMPEYVVGAKLKKEKKIKSAKALEPTKAMLTLSHLTYEDDIDDDK